MTNTKTLGHAAYLFVLLVVFFVYLVRVVVDLEGIMVTGVAL
jgi:hypothetical protein